ncbi:MAG: Mov34/MPN/PAD-1 family protein [Burkholderiaceae bacterium]
MAIKWQDASPAQRLPVLEGRDAGVDVFVDPAAERIVQAHLATAPVELGGLLIGRAWAHPDGAVAHVAIEKAIPAEQSEGTSVSLRMGTTVWQLARAAMDADHLIVGWYHSHPGLTAFFSDTDRQTQAAFFSHDYSIGWVVDPVIGDEAMFIGAQCRPVARGPAAWPTPASKPPDADQR